MNRPKKKDFATVFEYVKALEKYIDFLRDAHILAVEMYKDQKKQVEELKKLLR